eukprot:TRINITY_DN176_c0_g1_i1.p1 TRINITY_DN176_c0_g1~~TRINITY_DN176_c0_g1_i1.p1  ORF type:complete len:277 (+),score=43.07 TRINITY_DN176_c0_g1_i1:283-1113(+)
MTSPSLNVAATTAAAATTDINLVSHATAATKNEDRSTTVDIEAQEEASSNATDHFETKSSSCDGRVRLCCCKVTKTQRRLCTCFASCFTLLLTLIGVSVALLWPRDPTWSLTKLDLEKDQLTTLMSVMTPEGLAKLGNKTIPPITVAAAVSLENPNLLGAQAEPARIDVYLHGWHLATGLGKKVYVPGRSKVVTDAKVTIKLTHEKAQELVGELFHDNFMLSVKVSASTDVNAPLGIKVRCGMRCSVSASLLKIVGPNPASLISSKKCDYTYDVLL